MKDFLTRSRWSNWDRVMLALSGLVLLWALTPYVWPASSWIEVIDVRVADTVAGEDPEVEVHRVVYRSTDHGRYVVAVRHAETHQLECVAARAVPYNSRVGGDPIIGKTLKWWAYAEDGECLRWPVPPGVYYMTTKHCWRRFWWTREACNERNFSNVFRVAER